MRDYTVVEASFRHRVTNELDSEIFMKTGNYWHIPGNEAFWLESDKELEEFATEGYIVIAEPSIAFELEPYIDQLWDSLGSGEIIWVQDDLLQSYTNMAMAYNRLAEQADIVCTYFRTLTR